MTSAAPIVAEGSEAAGGLLFARVPVVTGGLIALMVAAYLGLEGAPTSDAVELLRLGGKSRDLLVELGQWWRLFTAPLVHVSAWHLAVNAFFLLNVGGPVEAVYRRLDYLVVLVASALGAGLVSAVASPQATCGASGVVFGAWGTLALFGLRHWRRLGSRYRVYFLGSVIPYALFSLTMSLARPGVDRFGHLGGLVAGVLAASLLSPRWVGPARRRHALGVLAVVALAVTLGALVPFGPGALVSFRGPGGLVLPVPARWRPVAVSARSGRSSYAWANAASVAVGVERAPDDDSDALSLARRFVERDLARELEARRVRGLRLSEPEPTTVAGSAAARVVVEVLTASGVSRHVYLVLARAGHRFVISQSTPAWLAPAYQATFDRIVAGISFAPDGSP